MTSTSITPLVVLSCNHSTTPYRDRGACQQATVYSVYSTSLVVIRDSLLSTSHDSRRFCFAFQVLLSLPSDNTQPAYHRVLLLLARAVVHLIPVSRLQRCCAFYPAVTNFRVGKDLRMPSWAGKQVSGSLHWLYIKLMPSDRQAIPDRRRHGFSAVTRFSIEHFGTHSNGIGFSSSSATTFRYRYSANCAFEKEPRNGRVWYRESCKSRYVLG